jgi:hypothetical protein
LSFQVTPGFYSVAGAGIHPSVNGPASAGVNPDVELEVPFDLLKVTGNLVRPKERIVCAVICRVCVRDKLDGRENECRAGGSGRLAYKVIEIRLLLSNAPSLEN